MKEQVYIPALIGLFYTGPTLAYIVRKLQSEMNSRHARCIWERWETSSSTSIDNDLSIEVMTPERKCPTCSRI